MKQFLRHSTLAFGTAVLLLACKKDGLPQQDNPKPDGKLTVRLNGYVPSVQIDSALLLWQNGSEEDTLRLINHGNELSTMLNRLPAAATDYRIVLFTKNRLGSANLLWEKKLRLAAFATPARSLDAPTRLTDSLWLPRVVLNDQTGLTAFSGIRVTDPYFHIHRISRDWTELAFSRTYWNTKGGVAQVGGREWRANHVLDAKGNYTNNDFFLPLPQQIGNRQWNHIELVFLFTSADRQQMRVLDYNQDF